MRSHFSVLVYVSVYEVSLDGYMSRIWVYVKLSDIFLFVYPREWGLWSLGFYFGGGCIMWVFKYVCDCMTYDVALWSLWTCVSYGIKCLSSLLVYIPSVRFLICWVVYFQECKVSDLFVAIYQYVSLFSLVYVEACLCVYFPGYEVSDLFLGVCHRVRSPWSVCPQKSLYVRSLIFSWLYQEFEVFHLLWLLFQGVTSVLCLWLSVLEF